MAIEFDFNASPNSLNQFKKDLEGKTKDLEVTFKATDEILKKLKQAVDDYFKKQENQIQLSFKPADQVLDKLKTDITTYFKDQKNPIELFFTLQDKNITELKDKIQKRFEKSTAIKLKPQIDMRSAAVTVKLKSTDAFRAEIENALKQPFTINVNSNVSSNPSTSTPPTAAAPSINASSYSIVPSGSGGASSATNSTATTNNNTSSSTGTTANTSTATNPTVPQSANTAYVLTNPSPISGGLSSTTSGVDNTVLNHLIQVNIDLTAALTQFGNQLAAAATTNSNNNTAGTPGPQGSPLNPPTIPTSATTQAQPQLDPNDSLSSFSNNVDKTTAVVNKFATLLRDTVMMGIPIPRMLSEVTSYLRTGLEMFPKISSSVFAADNAVKTWLTSSNSLKVPDIQQLTSDVSSDKILTTSGKQITAEKLLRRSEVAGNKAYAATPRARDDTDDTFRERQAKAFAEAFERALTKNSGGSEVGVITKIRNNATIKDRLDTGTSGWARRGDGQSAIAKATGGIGKNIARAVPRLFTFIAKQLARLGGLALGAIMFVVSKAYAIGQWMWERYNKFQDAYMAKRQAFESVITQIQVANIEKVTNIELDQLKTRGELDRKRMEQQRTLAASRLKMNSTEIAAQKAINRLELERMEAQKQNERFRMSKDTLRRTMEVNDTFANSKRDIISGATWEGGSTWRRLGVSDIVTEHGDVLNSSVREAAAKGWSQTTEDRNLKSILQTYKNAHTVLMAEGDRVVKTTMQGYEDFLEFVATANPGKYSEGLRTKIEAAKKDQEEVLSKMSEDKVIIGEAIMFASSWEENLKAKRIKWDETTQAFVSTVEGSAQVYKNKDEFDQFAKTIGQLEIQRAEDMKREATYAQRRNNALKVEIEIEGKVQHLIQERKQMQADLLKELATSLDTNGENRARNNSSNWKQFGFEMDSNRQKEMFASAQQIAYGVALSSGLKGDDLKMFKRMQAQAAGANDAKQTAAVEREKELFELQLTHEKEKYDLEMEHIKAAFKLTQDNAGAATQTKIANAKIYREAGYNTQRQVLETELSLADVYGKSVREIQKLMAQNTLNKYFEKRNADTETKHNTIEREALTDESTKQLKDMQDLEKKQQIAMAEKQKQLAIQKWDLEDKLMQAQFQKQIKMIQAEVEFEFNLKQRYEEASTVADKEMWKKIMADPDLHGQAYDIAKKKFNKNVEDLNLDERNQVTAEMRTLGEQAAETLLEALGKNGKSFSKYFEGEKAGNGVRDKLAQSEYNKKWNELDTSQQTKLKLKAQGDFIKEKTKDIDTDNAARLKKAQTEADKEWATVQKEREQSSTRIKSRKLLDDVMKETDSMHNLQRADATASGAIPILSPASATEQLKTLGVTNTQAIDPINKQLNEYYETIYDRRNSQRNESEESTYQQKKAKLEQAVIDSLETVQAHVENKNYKSDSAAQAAIYENKANEHGLTYIGDRQFSLGDKDLDLQEALKNYQTFGSAAADATNAQTVVMIEIGEKLGKLFQDQMKGANQETEDVMKQIREAEVKRQNVQKEFETQQANEKEKLQADQATARDESAAKRAKNKENETNANALSKQAASGIVEMIDARRARKEKFGGDIINMRGEAYRSQMNTNSDFAVNIAGAKTGTDWLRAVSTRNRDTYFNAQEAAMKERQRRETEAYEQGGYTSEEGRAALEQRHQTEAASMANSKKMVDAITNSLSVGSLRSLVTEGTGNKSDLESTWERIQQSAFGHITDPAADAVITMDRNMQLQHAALMSALNLNLPQIARGVNNQKAVVAQSMINTYASHVGLGSGSTIGER